MAWLGTSDSEFLEEGDRILNTEDSDVDFHARSVRLPRRIINGRTLLASAGGAIALSGVCIAGSRMKSTTTARVTDGIVMAEVGVFPPCSPDESLCPVEWSFNPTGGYFCRTMGGCAEWTEEGSFFPKEVCPDQCSIGNTPAVTPANPPPAIPAPAAGTPPAAAHGPAPAAPAPPANPAAPAAPAPADAYTIPLCNPDEFYGCPQDWQFGQYGGYLCRETGGCAAWSKEGGAFPKEVCADQCSIGNTPSTRTTTTTQTTTITSTITSTYAGMGIKLLCWSLAQPGYEFDILKRQKQMGAGIFACEDQAILSFTKESLNVDGDYIETWVCEKMPAGISKDGTSANTEQFMKAWEVIKNGHRWEKADWTVKVDPDAVLLPDRLRMHLNPTNGGNVYVRNCDKPMSEGTMMFGALEAISHQALATYYANFDVCKTEVPWQSWGEDLFMMRCLEHVGVGVFEDFSIIQDGVCKGVWCGDSWAAAFHPMKSVPAWEGCWHEAIAAR